MDDQIKFECSGLNEHGNRCGNMLFALRAGAEAKAIGLIVEVLCRRCRTLNIVKLADVVGGPVRQKAVPVV